MIGELKYLDVCEIQFEPFQKFCVQRKNHLAAISTNSGVLLLKLQPDFEKAVNSVTYCKLFIKPSSYMLNAHIEIDISKLIFDLPQDSVYMCLLQSNVSGSLENLKKKNFFINKCSISPMRLIGEEPVIATISDVGSIDVYVKVVHITGLETYEHILNVNGMHIERFKFRWNNVQGMSTEGSYVEALRRLSMHTAKVVSWTHMLQHSTSIHGKKGKIITSEYCCMIVAYGDGKIVFWQMNQIPMDHYKQAAFTFMFEYQSGMDDITALCWHEAKVNSGLLVIGDKSGKTVAVPVLNIVMNYCEKGNEIILTDSTDIAVDYLDVEVKDKHLIIHIIQQQHLLLITLNKNAEVCHRMDYNCGNLNISGFQKTLADTVILSTITGCIIELKTSITANNELHIDKKDIYVNMDWSKNTLIGFYLSKNNAILSLLTHHFGYNYKGLLKMKIWNFANNGENSLHRFLKLDRISDGLDLLEVMRIRSLQKREFICNELPENTNYDSLTLAELKRYLCLAKMSEAIFDQVETVTHYNLKQSSDICTMIYIQLSISLLQDVVSELNLKGAVSEYKRQVGHVCFTNLKDIVMSNFLLEHNLKNYTVAIQLVLNACSGLMIESTFCNICEVMYAGLSCPSPHSDFRCAFTMVQILNSKLKCPMCDCYIAEEAVAFNKDLSCAMCDSPLDTVISHSKEAFSPEAFCNEDCLSNE